MGKALQGLSALLFVGAVALVGLSLFSEPTTEEQQQQFSPLPRTERIVYLPEDGDLWQLVLVYSDKLSNPRDRELAAMFASTPRLQSLVAQTKVYELSPSHFWVKNRLDANETPAVILQAVDPAKNAVARPIYKASGTDMPLDGEQLADEIQAKIEEHFPEVRAKRDARWARDCPNCPPNERPSDSRRPTSTRIPNMRPTSSVTGLAGDNQLAIVLVGGSILAAFLSARAKK